MIIKGNSVGYPLPDPRKGMDMEGNGINNLADPENAGDAVPKKYVDGHTENTNNPHGVTAEQVGATPASHATDKNNPHGVTAEQIKALANNAWADYATVLEAAMAMPKTGGSFFAVGDNKLLGAADSAFPNQEVTYFMLTDESISAARRTVIAIPYGSAQGVKYRTIWSGAWQQSEWGYLARPDEIGAVIGNGNLSVGTDLNTITTSGIYRVNIPTNSPPPCAYGQLLVLHGADDTIAQIIFDHTDSRMFVRDGNPVAIGGVEGFGRWNDWVEVCTTGNNMKLLWENASIESEFAAQTISLDLSKYRMVLFEYILTGTSYPLSRIIPVGYMTKITESHVYYEDGGNSLQTFHRRLTVNGSGIQFEDGYNHTSINMVDNKMIKPLRIYGII